MQSQYHGTRVRPVHAIAHTGLLTWHNKDGCDFMRPISNEQLVQSSNRTFVQNAPGPLSQPLELGLASPGSLPGELKQPQDIRLA